MPNIPPIDDLEDLSATGAMLEGVLRQWVQEITECSPPDIVTFAEAIDFFARLTAIRKTLIKLSRLSKPRPNNPSPAPESKRSRAADLPSSPVDLPEPDIPQIRSLRDVPLDRIRPELDQISAAFADCGLPISDCEIPASNQSLPYAPKDPLDPLAPRPHDSQIRNPQSELRNPSLPRDPRCVALNIHPIVGDTSRFADHHPFFDRALYGHFNPARNSPWHRKKNRRFG
ncbi:MAG: hypothetical protein ABFD69_06685 [Candidatus Sumerlaeia bacterium]